VSTGCNATSQSSVVVRRRGQRTRLGQQPDVLVDVRRKGRIDDINGAEAHVAVRVECRALRAVGATMQPVGSARERIVRELDEALGLTMADDARIDTRHTGEL
jgi:hypothetical protein